MSRYLVTGAAGFIASRVCSHLLENGHEVVGIDNLNEYYDLRLKKWRLNLLRESYSDPPFHFLKMDVEDQSSIGSLFATSGPFDAVLNLAARAGVRYSMINPHVYFSTNTVGTLNLLEAMRANSCNKMVMASTSSLYTGQSMPFAESLPVNEPLSPYAVSKKSAELLAYSYHKLYGLDFSVLRYFTVFGPAGRPDMSIFRFIKWIDEGIPIELFGDGSQSRDFTYVEDIARGSIAALKSVGYEIINMGGGRNPVSHNSIIERLEKLLGKTARVDRKPFHVADVKETWADIEKAWKLLGWKPKVSLDEGLERTVEWYLANREWLKNIRL